VSIRIRKLRLVGAAKSYEVDFTDDGGAVRPLSTIAGEISTGKTSILQFINYCLGSSRHPQHIEIRRQARSAQLEVELDHEVHVIERPLFSQEKVAFVHHCSLEELKADAPHAKSVKPIEPAGDGASLSMFLLDFVGLAGMSLKEAPTREDSGTDPLSFRDLMWLCYLPNTRLDNEQLLHERNFMEELKLRQVIEIVFEVYDDEAAKLSEAVRRAEEEARRQQIEIDSLERFLSDEDVPDAMTLAARLSEVDSRVGDLSGTLDSLSREMRAQSDFAEQLRASYGAARQAAANEASRVRYQETLLRRLLPLQSQYAEDESKLVFYDEAKTLFDPMQIVICPSCLQRLPDPAAIQDGECSLCHQAIVPTDAEPIEVKAEIASVRARMRELDRYIGDVQTELEDARRSLERVQEEERAAQEALDSEVSARLSPYVAQREGLVRERESLRAQRADVERQRGWLQALDHRRDELIRLQARATELRKRLRALEDTRRPKSDVVEDLTQRFESILRRFDYPKLDDPEEPRIDNRFVPWVRGTVYREIGSSGALTLISLAWQLAIFERAVELGHPHPGFLMIDSPQKNLKPREGEASEFTRPEITRNVWAHILDWASTAGTTAQVIVVDNEPPSIADESVVVRYGGAYGPAPYGLIDNETG
jgi:hypothetical protein